MRLYSDVSLRTVLLTLTGVVVLLSVMATVELGRDAIVAGRVAAVVIAVLWLGAAFLMRHPSLRLDARAFLHVRQRRIDIDGMCTSVRRRRGPRSERVAPRGAAPGPSWAISLTCRRR
jgi:hypothetical protein